MQNVLSRKMRVAASCAVLSLAVPGLAACGGDDDDSSSSAAAPAATQTTATAQQQPAAAKPTGTPFKVMVISAVDTPIQDYPDVFAAAQAAANAINDKGGVAGHPIEIETCNDKSDPNGAVACARKAVTDKAAAVTQYSIGGAGSMPVLDKAGIQVVPQLSTPPDYTATNAWPTVGSSFTTFQAIPFALQQAGKTKMAIAATDVSSATGKAPLLKEAAQKAGIKYVGLVKMPVDATDFAPFVQQLKATGADSVAVAASAAQIIQLQKTAEQLGLDVTFANHAGSISPEVIKELGDAAEGTVVLDSVPVVSSPKMKQFNADMDAAKAAGVSDTENRRMATQEMWLDVNALAALMKDADPKAPIDAAAVKAALEKATTIDVDGIVQWEPNKPGPKEYPRVANGTVYPGVVKNGEVQATGDPNGIDSFALLGQS